MHVSSRLARVLPGYCLGTAWVLPGYCLGSAWLGFEPSEAYADVSVRLNQHERRLVLA